MMNNVLKSVSLGIKRRWKSALTKAFGSIGAIWTLTEILTRTSKSADEWMNRNADLYTLGLALTSGLVLAKALYETRQVSFLIPTTDCRITIKFGDIFQQNTDIMIGVNEFFDSKIGFFVAKDSLHGKVIDGIYNGNEERFRNDVDKALAGINSTLTERSEGPTTKYNIGTTAVLRNGSCNLYLVAISNTDVTTAKASSTVAHLWTGLHGALRSVQDNGNGAPISIPLIGNGRSNINLEPQHLLRVITLAIVDFGRKHGLPKKVYIIAHEGCFEMLDIREIRRDWSKS